MVGDGLIESIFNRKVRAIAKGHSGNCTAKKRGEKEGRQRRIHSIRNIFRQRRRGDDIYVLEGFLYGFLLFTARLSCGYQGYLKHPELTDANSLE